MEERIAMDTKITEMKIADYDEVFALWQDTEGVGLHPDECDSRRGIGRYLARNPGLCFVARDGAKLVGTVLCGTDGRRGYLNHLAVVPGHRREGLGTALVRRCLAALKEIGIPKCNLFVLADNKAAIAFWEKLGWCVYEEVGVKAMTLRIE